MAYYFTVKKKDEFKCIDLSLHPYFERLSKYQGNKYSLEEIDKFTSSYANELTLRESLYYNGLLDEEEVYKEISVRFKNNGQLSKVRYNPVYQESMKYLDPLFLNYKLKILSSDHTFLNKFLSYYRNSSVNNEIIAAIREYTYGNPELNIYKLLDEFINREIYNRRYNFDTKLYEYISIKYKSLHDLAMFVYNYDKEPEISKNEIKEELNKFISYYKKENNTQKLKVKTRKKILDGQTSFLD